MPMTSLADSILRTRAPELSADDYAMALRRVRDPIVELGRFRASLLTAVRARQHTLGSGVTSERLRFAADTLARVRVRGAQLHLKRSMVVGTVFGEFLRCSSGIAVEAIALAETADDLADALLDALDSLHTYLLTHELVDDGYQEAEAALVKR